MSLLLLTGVSFGQDLAGEEILYPGGEFAKLDTFEGVNLEDADKLFGKKDYKGAYAAYKAYSFEFAKSAALPYVLLRMGRCLHKLEKRNAAIKAYQDVVDYFPDAVRYAAASLIIWESVTFSMEMRPRRRRLGPRWSKTMNTSPSPIQELLWHTSGR